MIHMGLITQFYSPLLTILLFVLSVSLFWFFLYAFNRNSILRRSSIFSFFPKISVVIPAYNEERNISKMLNSLFKTNYPKQKMEVIVVDDGSEDRTKSIAGKYPVKIISYKPNGGKIYALNKGVKAAKGEVVVTLDADVEATPDTVSSLVQKFRNKEIGAVAGAYKAKSVFSKNKIFSYLLEKFQSIEYASFALIRKQQELFDSILIVPGAIAAYRRSALKEVGFFDNDTLIEDYDITVKMHKAGYKVASERNALVYVLAPQKLISLIRERTRWYRGGLQVMRKHMDVFSGKLGVVSALWIVESASIMLQFMLLGLLSSNFYTQLTSMSLFNILTALKGFLLSILSLQAFLDPMTLVAFMVFITGLANTFLSLRFLEEGWTKIVLYPLMAFYTTILFLVFIKSFLQEICGINSKWIKAEAS